MNLVYAAMLLDSASKEINEENVKKIVNAVGVKVEDAQIKALVAALESVNIKEEIEKAREIQVTAVAKEEKKEVKKEEKKEEEEKKAEEAAAGLGALFG